MGEQEEIIEESEKEETEIIDLGIEEGDGEEDDGYLGSLLDDE